MTHPRVPCQLLGQAGVRFQFPSAVTYVDPYLTDSLADALGSDYTRLVAVPVAPEAVTDADWVFITHAHADHCDRETLVPLAASSPAARFVGPGPVITLLESWGIDQSRLHVARAGWMEIAPGTRVCVVPAAHPVERPAEGGGTECVGFVFEVGGRRIYHAGDTCATANLQSALRGCAPIDAWFLPVNERNYFRERAGIIGNMSVREAFQLAAEGGARVVIPIHWDLFKLNSVAREELLLLYRLLAPAFELCIEPEWV